MAKEKPTKQEAPAEPAEPKKKSPLMKYLIIAGILLAQTAAAYFIQKTVFFPDTHADSEAVAEDSAAVSGHGEEAAEGETEGTHGGAAVSSSVTMLDEIIVNPAGTGGRRFLSTIVGLTLKDPKTEPLVQAQMPIIRDAAITLLASKSLDQLASIGYRDTLRTELVASINGLVKEAPVAGIVFSTYVLQ
jgi:flagellar FliL protein